MVADDGGGSEEYLGVRLVSWSGRHQANGFGSDDAIQLRVVEQSVRRAAQLGDLHDAMLVRDETGSSARTGSRRRTARRFTDRSNASCVPPGKELVEWGEVVVRPLCVTDEMGDSGGQVIVQLVELGTVDLR